jgi:hypothetical protein
MSFGTVQQGLILYPNCVPEKWGVNQRGVHQKRYFNKKERFNLLAPEIDI